MMLSLEQSHCRIDVGRCFIIIKVNESWCIDCVASMEAT